MDGPSARVIGDRIGAARLASIVVACVLAVPLVTPVSVGADEHTTALVADSFSRTVSTGWDTADVGGAWQHGRYAAAFSVDGSAGNLTLGKAGASRFAASTASARDIDGRVRLQVDRLPSGGGLWIYSPARINGDSEYRPKIVVGPSGSLSVHAGVAINGAESSLGPMVMVSGLTVTPGTSIWLRSSVTGADPTTISVKAWAEGTPEPGSWQFSATNSAAALQVAGSVGVRAYVSSITNAPINVSFDDLAVDSLDTPPVPAASFEWAQQTGTLDVAFTDTSAGEPSAWEWDFGDGSLSTDRHPTHSFVSDGTYTVTLTVTNTFGSDSVNHPVAVSPVPPPPPSETVVLAADTFDRTQSGSWTVADEGGLYSYQGRLSDFSVAGSTGRLVLPAAGATRSAFLLSPLALDVDMTFAVSTDKPAAGAAIFVYGSVRRSTDGAAYRPKLRFAPSGAVFAHAGRVAATGGESSLGPAVEVDGLTHAAGTVIRFRAQAIGSNPTTIRVRAWADGQPEPDTWHFTATDNAAKLQEPGAVGVLSHLSSGSTNSPVTVALDGLLVTTTAPIDRVEGADFVGAGDIAVCNSGPDDATATLLDMLAGTIYTVGDNAYPDGTAEDFANCYEPSWGRHKGRTYPAVGNHEYHLSSDASPYFDYFGAVAGERGKGWYAYDTGTWRVYVLNSNCTYVDCTAGSEQEQWLRADLAANPRTCSVAVWHYPRYSSATTHGSSMALQPFWQALHDAGAEILVSGHDHDYERFAPLDSSGAVDSTTGIRQFVVGTGGAGLRRGFATPLPGSEVREDKSHGLLRLVLGDGEYEWEFIPIAGQQFTDRGSGTCH